MKLIKQCIISFAIAGLLFGSAAFAASTTQTSPQHPVTKVQQANCISCF